MDRDLFISNWVRINRNRISANDTVIAEFTPELKLKEFLKQSYKELKIDYPKFYKMDSLCKLGILASEVLSGEEEFSEDTAMVFSNSLSSLDTDEKFRKSMEEFPSPSVFVYTLPNIVLGEISIKHRLLGENAFFISESFDPGLFMDYSQSLLEENISSEVLCGWIDLHNEEYDVFLWRISDEGPLVLSEENLKRLYHFYND